MLLHAEQALLPEGWARDVRVRIVAGRIAEVTPGAAPEGERVACLLPALANLHSHAFQRAMAGMTEARTAGQDSFWTWRALMYRFLDRLTPPDVEAIAAQVMVEMAEAGYAAVTEFHYLHHAPDGSAYADRAEMAGRIAAASAETGLGLTLLPVIYERGGCDGRALTGGQRRFHNDPGGFGAMLEATSRHLKALPPDAALGVAPHSLRAVTPETLARVAQMTLGPIHMHLAEQQAEVDEVLAATGARPVSWALDQLPLGPRWCLVHCTQMTPRETACLAATGAVAGLCPITEANLGDGIFDATGWRAGGGAWGVGSDSNILISLAEELRSLEYSQRLRDRARAVLAAADRSVGRTLWDEAARGGARAAGRASGAIAAGLWADLLAPDMAAPVLAGRRGDEILDGFVFCGTAGLVDRLWSAGRPLVRAGRHVARDVIAQRFRATLAGLRDRT
ncbi:formimidoylglutamate deiminase [Rhodobacter sp. Har01]|uniref:formimidoylglutamate deiminase n=1 Tax=Rhodobacter sp. Har01 TaxID=2883999 RepID=UPI001D089B31|nr:formimidoylglutamate deiminase [Rhodobacter sp. Har01]MCB6177590.1 formimidoylglutamate deiminase [Rhodobacter sp. Har01]